MNGTLKAAQLCVKHGISCLAIESVGKRPKSELLPLYTDEQGKQTRGWKPFQERLPNPDELLTMFSNGAGFAVITGRVSLNLELIDFDVPGKKGGATGVCPHYQPFCDLVTEHGEGDLLKRLGMALTPSGGVHLVYRCEEPIEEGNQPLAHIMHGGKKVTTIETRGEGGYFATFPTEGYKAVRGLFSKIPVINLKEREFLINCAKSLEECYDEPEEVWQTAQPRRGNNKRPGDRFNDEGDLTPYLQKHGWQQFGKTTQGRSTWVRPGKQRKDGPSATYDPSRGLYVFSSNASPFDSGRGYSKFQAFTMLEHHGDFHESAQWLVKNGYSSYEQASKSVKSSETAYREDVAIVEATRPKFVLLDDVEEETIDWIWQPYFAKGMTALIAGDPGIGKGMCLKAIATAFTIGKGLPGMRPQEPGNVLLLFPEDSNAKVTKPIMRKMGADMKRVKVLSGSSLLTGEFAEDIEREIVDWDVKLLGLDPIIAFLDGKMDMHKQNQVRASLSRLVEIIERRNIAGVFVAHLNKSTMGKGIHRVAGSIDFVAIVRSVLLAVSDPDDHDLRGLVHEKCNWGPVGKTLGYTVDDGEFRWTGDSELTSERSMEQPVKVETASQKAAAKEWLADYLMQGPVGSLQVFKDAKDAGFSGSTLRRAKSELGVKPIRNSTGRDGSGDWAWELVKIAPEIAPSAYWNKDLEYDPMTDTD